MHDRSATEHHRLCTVELIAEGHASRCPGDACAFWDRGCVLTRVEVELDGRPEVAQLLVELRRDLEAGRAIEITDARTMLAGAFDGGGEPSEPL